MQFDWSSRASRPKFVHISCLKRQFQSSGKKALICDIHHIAGAAAMLILVLRPVVSREIRYRKVGPCSQKGLIYNFRR